MIKIGQYHNLRITQVCDSGYLLDGENYGEISLPKKYASKELRVGDQTKIFLYLDSDDKPAATAQTPLARVGQFAYLKAIDKNKVGAFLDWGLDKDLLLPFGEQHKNIEVGQSYLVYIYIDKIDSRITASSKIDKFLDYDREHSFKPHEPVDLIIANSTELGFKAIINHSHWGMLYKSDVSQKLSFGQSIGGYIHRIRDDNRIDLILHNSTLSRTKDEHVILNYLQRNNGKCAVHDKSDPQLIANTFSMSKGAFKRALGGLYKQKKITISKNGISLNQYRKEE